MANVLRSLHSAIIGQSANPEQFFVEFPRKAPCIVLKFFGDELLQYLCEGISGSVCLITSGFVNEGK